MIELVVQGLSIGYSSRSILSNLSFRASGGELIALMGENGCGKSTLLRTLVGIIPFQSGSVRIDKKEIFGYTRKELSQKASFVSTVKPDVDHMTIREVVSTARVMNSSFFGILSSKDIDLVNDALKKVNLLEMSDFVFKSLSDGQKQKVLLARAIAQDTPIIFLDEPTTYLDNKNKLELVMTLRKLVSEKSKLIIFSTHDWDLVREFVPKVFFIDSGDLIETSANKLILEEKLSSFIPDGFYLDKSTGVILHKEINRNSEPE